jgi:hypothetical protein
VGCGDVAANAELRDHDTEIEVTALVEQVPDLAPCGSLSSSQESTSAPLSPCSLGVGLVTTDLTTFGGLDLVDGPLHLYDVRPVAGTAEALLR